MSWWAWLATFAISCGQPTSTQGARRPSGTGSASIDAGVADAPKTLADDLQAHALRAKQLYLDWQAALADPNIDCATATARMNELADKNADLLAANLVVRKGGHARIKAFREELDKYEEEIKPAAKAVIESPIMMRCDTDPSFARAVDRLGGEG